MNRAILFLAALMLAPFAGCLSPALEDEPLQPDATGAEAPPFLGYEPAAPDLALDLVEASVLLPGDGVEIHARIVRPAGDGPFPVIAQFTPYTAPGRSAELNNLIEPAVQASPASLESRFVQEFVRRGYAFAFADVRGTGDSSGCLDLRGNADIADLYELTEWLGTREWSSGKVGFIGASYPGSEAHMAALANNPYLAAVVPIVASTSFYHYHHNDGVPYMGQHSLGGTNTGYTAFALAPTVNPQHGYAERYAEEAGCGYEENMLDHGGMDQTGAYYEWWQERNLRPRAETVGVPVLMAQGLADWNVKPDHIATWFNDIPGQKTLIAGQWGHAYPSEAVDAYGDWWTYVTAFFDTHVKGADTGMFQQDVAWVQDTEGDWHRSANWPLLPTERAALTLHLNADGTATPEAEGDDGELTWNACPRHKVTKGATGAAWVESATSPCNEDGTRKSLEFTTQPIEEDLLVSGVPLVNFTVKSSVEFTHLTVVMEVIGKNGEVRRENYGYLNPTFRHGLDTPEPIPLGEPYTVTVDFYPQEDVLKKGEKLRFRVGSTDGGRTIEAFDEGENALVFGDGLENAVFLPLRPADLTGVRLG